MNYYQEISMVPKTRIELHIFWQMLYKQIHLALVENKIAQNSSTIGVGFPEYDAIKKSLGYRLRLFAKEKNDLVQLDCEEWLKSLDDYVHIHSIKAIPDNVSDYAYFQRIHLKGNKEKLARRRAKRKGKTLQQALADFDEYEEQQSSLLYINMDSQTTGKRFKLFIEKKVIRKQQTGLFSCYGLSKKTTIPCF